MTWTHRSGEHDHPVDPKYNGSGWMGGAQPSYWVCHTCREAVLLNGSKPPVTISVEKAAPKPESNMSGQP